MTAPRYALYPGVINSRIDGQRHYIDARTLADLYRVQLSDCIVVEFGDYSKPWERPKIERASKLPALTPRYDGDYSLPGATDLKSVERTPETGASIEESRNA